MKKFTFVLELLLSVYVLSSCSGGGADYSMMPVSSDGKAYGYIDNEGNYVINPQFESASMFYDNRALVKVNNKFGYIDKSGTIVIPANYKNALDFSEGVAIVVSDCGMPTAIDKNGEKLFELSAAEKLFSFSDGLAKFSQVKDDETMYGFVDKKGTQVIPPIYKKASMFSEGLCAVKSGDKWGYIDTKGKTVLNPQFDNAGDFKNGYAVVSSGKYGIIDKSGKYVANPQFDNLYSDGKNFIAYNGENYGWCDEKGKLFINPQFREVNRFNSEKLAPVSSGDNYGYINDEGSYVINPQFSSAGCFLPNGLAPVYSSSGYGFIDKKGSYVINCQFSRIADSLIPSLRDESDKKCVETDYVDISAITQRINYNAPEGKKLEEYTFADACADFSLDSTRMSNYENDIKKEKINSKLSYEVSITGQPYTSVRKTYVGFDWWGRAVSEYRYVKVFNADSIVSGFKYAFRISDADNDKVRYVAKAIKPGSPFKEVSADDKNISYTYQSDSKTVNIEGNGWSGITVEILNGVKKVSKKGKETSRSIEDIQDDAEAIAAEIEDVYSRISDYNSDDY